MGSRTGIEVDYFRIVFFSNIFFSILLQFTETKKLGFGFFPLLKFFFRFNRSNKNSIINNKPNVLGNDINYKSNRKDTIVCSFDKFEKKYHNKFDLLYTNSFDQSFDPQKSLDEWKKLLKKNGLLILGFDESAPSILDPTGNININDLMTMSKLEIKYYFKDTFTYNYIIFKKNF